MSVVTAINQAHESKSQAIDMLSVSVDGQLFLLERDAVKSCQSIKGIDTGEPVRKSVGWIAFDHARYPVYSMNTDLDLVDEIDANRKLCLVMPEASCAILCDEIKPQQIDSMMIHKIPECMAIDSTPIEAYAISSGMDGLDHTIILSSSRLKQFINRFAR